MQSASAEAGWLHAGLGQRARVNTLRRLVPLAFPQVNVWLGKQNKVKLSELRAVRSAAAPEAEPKEGTTP